MKNKTLLLILVFSSLIQLALAQQVKVVPFISNGGRVDWAQRGIAYDFLDTATGYYEMAFIKPNGSGFKNLTKGVANIPQKHNGNPAWYYPNGRYIVYEAEKDSNYNPADAFYGSDANSTPGIGLNSDLWVVDLQTNTFTRLTNLPTKRSRLDTTKTSGLFHPQFSHDGTKILWAQCINASDTSRGTTLPGLWELNISDFDTTGGIPRLLSTVHYQTGGILGDFTFLETSGGFSPDDSTVVYCANANPNQLAGYIDIYSFNYLCNKVKELTPDTTVWNEHSHFTYTGNNILWMNSYGYTFIDEVTPVPRTEYWLMDKYGNNKKQVTFFNNHDSADYLFSDGGGIVTAGDNAWSPFGGDSAVCYLQTFSVNTIRQIVYLINAQHYVLNGVPSFNTETSEFTCYPNPAKNNVTINLTSVPLGPTDIKIYGVACDLLYTEHINNTRDLQTIQTNQLAAGIYFIQVTSGNMVLNKKMIIL